MNEDILIDELIRDEGERYFVYKDSLGIKTVGVGHNIESNSLPESMKHVLIGEPLTDDEVKELLKQDIARVLEECNSFTWFGGLSDVRKRAICNMVFNMGLSRFLGFRHMIEALEQCDFDKAAHEMLDSEWADQVGSRADRLERMIRTDSV